MNANKNHWRVFFVACGITCWLFSASTQRSRAAEASQTQAGQDSASWERVNTEDGDFSVYVPARPSFYVQRRYGHDGVKVTQAIIGGAYHDGVVFVTRIYELLEARELAGKVLERNCARLSEAGKAEGQDVINNSLRGKEYFKQDAGYVHRIQCFATARRFYVVEAAARDKDRPAVKKFFASLEVGGAGGAGSGIPSGPVQAPPPPGVAQEGGKVFGEGEVTRPAVIIHKPLARYNPVARAAMISGKVRLRLLLSASGEVTNIEVLKGEKGGLAGGAVATAKYIRFLPAEKDGRAVSQYAETDYTFTIEK